MSFQWSEYLAVAQHLVQHSASSSYAEACHRAAISRAYYAALLTARSLLSLQWGVEVPETAEIHTFIARWFLAEEGVEEQEIGALLDRLRNRRRRADYDDNVPNVGSLAARSLADAQTVIERLAHL